MVQVYGTIINCDNYASITAIDNDKTQGSGEVAGGVVGQAIGIIKDCKNKGNVLARNELGITGRGKFAGGIVAYGYGPLEISNCQNDGEVIAQYQKVGGIVGCADGSTGDFIINNCKNNANVSSSPINNTLHSLCVGGIVGEAADGVQIRNWINTAQITANNQQSGGIAGSISNQSLVSSCINTGTIVSNAAGGRGISGGIVGMMNSARYN